MPYLVRLHRERSRRCITVLQENITPARFDNLSRLNVKAFQSLYVWDHEELVATLAFKSLDQRLNP